MIGVGREMRVHAVSSCPQLALLLPAVMPAHLFLHAHELKVFNFFTLFIFRENGREGESGQERDFHVREKHYGSGASYTCPSWGRNP